LLRPNPAQRAQQPEHETDRCSASEIAGAKEQRGGGPAGGVLIHHSTGVKSSQNFLPGRKKPNTAGLLICISSDPVGVACQNALLTPFS
jgi:hypothetical protein